MADYIDDAQAVNELHQEVSLHNHRLKMAPESHPDFDGQHCVDCECDMPVERLAWGRVRCVECQEHLDRVSKMRAIRGRDE